MKTIRTNVFTEATTSLDIPKTGYARLGGSLFRDGERVGAINSVQFDFTALTGYPIILISYLPFTAPR